LDWANKYSTSLARCLIFFFFLFFSPFPFELGKRVFDLSGRVYFFFWQAHTNALSQAHTNTPHTHTHTHVRGNDAERCTKSEATESERYNSRGHDADRCTKSSTHPFCKKKKSDNAGGNDADRCAKSEVTNCDRCAKSEDTNCSIHHLLHGQPLWGGMPADRVSKCVCIERV